MKNNKGFTLLEIIVVVFILSLLAAIVAPKIIGRLKFAIFGKFWPKKQKTKKKKL